MGESTRFGLCPRQGIVRFPISLCVVSEKDAAFFRHDHRSPERIEQPFRDFRRESKNTMMPLPARRKRRETSCDRQTAWLRFG